MLKYSPLPTIKKAKKTDIGIKLCRKKNQLLLWEGGGPAKLGAIQEVHKTKHVCLLFPNEHTS